MATSQDLLNQWQKVQLLYKDPEQQQRAMANWAEKNGVSAQQFSDTFGGTTDYWQGIADKWATQPTETTTVTTQTQQPAPASAQPTGDIVSAYNEMVRDVVRGEDIRSNLSEMGYSSAEIDDVFSRGGSGQRTIWTPDGSVNQEQFQSQLESRGAEGAVEWARRFNVPEDVIQSWTTDFQGGATDQGMLTGSTAAPTAGTGSNIPEIYQHIRNIEASSGGDWDTMMNNLITVGNEKGWSLDEIGQAFGADGDWARSQLQDAERYGDWVMSGDPSAGEVAQLIQYYQGNEMPEEWIRDKMTSLGRRYGIDAGLFDQAIGAEAGTTEQYLRDQGIWDAYNEPWTPNMPVDAGGGIGDGAGPPGAPQGYPAYNIDQERYNQYSRQINPGVAPDETLSEYYARLASSRPGGILGQGLMTSAPTPGSDAWNSQVISDMFPELQNNTVGGNTVGTQPAGDGGSGGAAIDWNDAPSWAQDLIMQAIPGMTMVDAVTAAAEYFGGGLEPGYSYSDPWDNPIFNSGGSSSGGSPSGGGGGAPADAPDTSGMGTTFI